MKNEDKLIDIANMNNGVLTTSAVEAAGLSRQILSRGKKMGWIQVMRGVWWPFEGEPTFDQFLHIARTVLPPEAKIGGQAALYMQDVINTAPEKLDFWVPNGHSYKVNNSGRIRIHRDRRNRFSRAREDSQFISIADCLTDVINEARTDVDAAGLSVAVRNRFPDDIDAIKEMLKKRKRLKHRLDAKAVFEADPAFDSALEYMWVKLVEKQHKMTPSERQWICPYGFRRDGVWQLFKAIYELDGEQFHTSPEQVIRDQERDRTAREMGYTTFRFTYPMVINNPCGCALTLARAIPELPIEPCGKNCPVASAKSQLNNSTSHLPTR